MKLSPRPFARLLSAIVLVGAAPLFAQEVEGQPAADAPPAAPAPAQPAQPVFQPTEQQVPVSKYLETADTNLKEMRTALTRGLEILTEARESKDAVRLQCVNDRITAMKGVLRISEDAYISLQEAMATRATEKARYEFSKIRTSHSKMQELAQAAQNCVGTEATVPGNTEVSVEIDPALAIQDPYYGNPDFFFTPEDQIAAPGGDGVGEDEGPVPTRPPVVSGFQG